ncbi:LacI family DNA-binding transcriptional regulator [Bifidobacterium eulemuris]|uniref:Transcriptional regulator n=1 Tax=Bifidobacterium eulemuris TaxID=1765219 RepID=A0A261G8I8_9BIFI|nr:LacI family DNA-binding transcriptional regulator [Bifidobacterium eulemuris]OZG67505.1 transcriptional regulator [Bifidobacterium eulemuris]QOL31046.1 LacI family DNA-binding transcriptional regulator [Bifidobacterium eulemuris]
MSTVVPTGIRGKATSKDVAKLAGVAQSTVSYYMNGSRPVSKDARARIEAAMATLDYHPNSSARTLRTQRTNLITLIERLDYESDASDVAPYLTSIIEEAYRQGYDVILNTTKADPDSLRRMDGRNICDGFILMDIKRHDERIPVAAQIGLPTVVFGKPDDAHGLDVIYFDYESAGAIIADYLAGFGHRTVVFLDENPLENSSYISYQSMYESLRKRCSDHGMSFDAIPFDRDHEQSAMEMVGENIHNRLAVVTRQPRSTKACMDALVRHNLIPGRDLTLVSLCPDSKIDSFSLQPSNLSQRPREISIQAVHMLIDRIEHPSRPQSIMTVKTDHVTTRDTTVDFRGEDD